MARQSYCPSKRGVVGFEAAFWREGGLGGRGLVPLLGGDDLDLAEVGGVRWDPLLDLAEPGGVCLARGFVLAEWGGDALGVLEDTDGDRVLISLPQLGRGVDFTTATSETAPPGCTQLDRTPPPCAFQSHFGSGAACPSRGVLSVDCISIHGMTVSTPPTRGDRELARVCVLTS